MSDAPAATGAARQPLDEVMLAMDVVDTLRRRERLVAAELDDATRRETLKDRLRDIYEAQGIEVPDRILEEGVKALTENRFVFDPPKSSLSVRLAHLYVSRGRWGKWVLGGIAILLVAALVNYVTVTRPNSRVGPDLVATYDEIRAETASDAALSQAGDLLQAGRSALERNDPDAARSSLVSLEKLREVVGQSYVLRIVNRPGENSGVWRVPDVNTDANNYYIIVEALDAAGRPVRVPVTNEETGRVEEVTEWGLRVDEATFGAIAADKRDDGIIQNNIFGRKDRGTLEPAYAFPTTGGAITRW